MISFDAAQHTFPILDTSRVGEARRAAVSLAERLGFNQVEQGKVAIIVTEVANNLIRHAKEGELLIRPQCTDQEISVEILGLDRGPGITNLAECLRDGYSTGGTSGAGMGAIVRQSSQFDIYSVPGSGTALLSAVRKTATESGGTMHGVAMGVVCLPVASEESCGDAGSAERNGNRLLFSIADGLGHGLLAAEAANVAIRIFRQSTRLAPAEILQAVHAGIRSTRGAAMAVAEINLDTRQVTYSGVGNISASIVVDGKSQSMVSHAGTLGHEARKFQEFTYAWPKGAVLIMHSDGLATQWQLTRYPGLLSRHPGLIAGVLYRDFRRVRDDVTVLVA